MNQPKTTDNCLPEPAPPLPQEAIPVWLHPSFLAIPDDTSLSEYDD